jgi:hypothetical protein
MVKLLHNNYVETLSIVCATFNINDISGIGSIPIFRHLSLSQQISHCFHFLLSHIQSVHEKAL